MQRPGYPQCLVKFLKLETNLEEARERFSQDMAVLFPLGQLAVIPQILAYYPERFCLVEEFIAGENLQQTIQSRQVLSETETMTILKEILLKLELIHGENLIHQNIQPANLIRRAVDGKLLLINLKLSAAKLKLQEITKIDGGETKIQGKTPANSFNYTPEEQLRGQPRAHNDIYALGAMAIFCLTGKSLGELQQDSSNLEKILQRETSLSKGKRAILGKMVCRDWRGRYQSATEVLKALERERKWRVRKKNVLMGVGAIAAILFIPPTLEFGRVVYLLSKANHLVELEDYHEAIFIYDRVLEIYPRSAKTWLQRAYPLSKLKRSEDQLDSCSEALAIEPNFIEALNCQGLALFDLERYEEAIVVYNKIIEIKANFYQAWNNKGEALVKLGKLEQALTAFQQASFYNESDPIIWNNRGKTLFKLQEYAQAEAAYSKAIALEPNYYYAWHSRGNAKRLLGHYQRAIEDYERAVSLKNDYYEAFYSKSLALMELNQFA